MLRQLSVMRIKQRGAKALYTPLLTPVSVVVCVLQRTAASHAIKRARQRNPQFTFNFLHDSIRNAQHALYCTIAMEFHLHKAVPELALLCIGQENE